MPTILQNHHVLAVRDVHASAKFYVDVLDFRIVNQPDGWIFVSRDHCMIMLGECPDSIDPVELGSHSYFAYFFVDNADIYHAHIKAKWANGIGRIEDKPWGMREFLVTTHDGHRIMIGQAIGTVADVLG